MINSTTTVFKKGGLASFSLFGNNPKYTNGMAENIKLCDKFGIKVFVYIEALDGNSVPGMFWRFFAPSDYDYYDYYIFRDADSRITEREVHAVNEWLESGKTLHVMRDHPHHYNNYPIFGGMWGIRGGTGLDIRKLVNDYLGERKFDTGVRMLDMDFLRDVIWEKFKDDCFQHDEFFNAYDGVHKFPTKRNGLEYVGEIYDQNNVPSELHRIFLKDFLDEHTTR